MANQSGLNAARVRDFYSRMLGEQARRRVLPYVGSRTLRAALRVQKAGRRWFLGVPHYWAVYYHDGRDASRPAGRWLVWYPNPTDDPRHRGNYPERAGQIRSLRDVGYTWEDVLADVDAGKAVIANLSPRNGRPVKGNKFFIRGLRNFFSTGGEERVRWLRDMIKGEFPEFFVHRTRHLRVYI